MDYTNIINSPNCDLSLKGSFTFSDHNKFREILLLLDQKELDQMTLDFSSVDFIDSAALGMLLLLRDEAKRRQIGVQLVNPQGQIKKMFDLARFDKIFVA